MSLGKSLVVCVGTCGVLAAGASAQAPAGPWANAVYRDLGALERSQTPITRDRPSPVLALSGDGQSVAFNLLEPSGSARATVWRTDGVYRFSQDPSLRFMRQALALNFDGSMVTVSADVVGLGTTTGLRATRAAVGSSIAAPQIITGSLPLGIGTAQPPGSVAFSPSLDAAVVRDVIFVPNGIGPNSIALRGFNSSGQFSQVTSPAPISQLTSLYAAGFLSDGTVIGRSRGSSTSQQQRTWTRSTDGTIVTADPVSANSFAPQRVVAEGQVLVGQATTASGVFPAYRVGTSGDVQIAPSRFMQPWSSGVNALWDASADGSVLLGGGASDLANTSPSPSTDNLAFVTIAGITYGATDFMRQFLSLPARYHSVTFTDVSDDGLSLAGIMLDSQAADVTQSLRVVHVTIPTPGATAAIALAALFTTRRRRA
jgi:hypothetical protein